MQIETGEIDGNVQNHVRFFKNHLKQHKYNGTTAKIRVPMNKEFIDSIVYL